MTVVLKIDPEKPDGKTIKEAARILGNGGVVAFPTETFYGLGADAKNAAAVDKIFRIKGRNFKNPVSVIAAHEGDVMVLVRKMPTAGRILMRKFWPGPLTLVLYASSSVPCRLTAGTGKIGIRISSHPVARLLAEELAGPVTATSANVSGGRECLTAEEAIHAFDNLLDAVIDGERTQGGLGSTILDVTVSPPVILREGAIPRADILDALGL